MFFDKHSSGNDGGMGLIFDDYGYGFRAGSGIDWNNIINQGFAVGSQAIGAWGRNPTTQVAYNPAQNSIFAIQGNQQAGYSANPYANMTAQQQAQLLQNAGVGGTVGSGIDGIFNWLMANPLITFGGIAALYLLMREPPRRR